MEKDWVGKWVVVRAGQGVRCYLERRSGGVQRYLDVLWPGLCRGAKQRAPTPQCPKGGQAPCFDTKGCPVHTSDMIGWYVGPVYTSDVIRCHVICHVSTMETRHVVIR